MPDYQGQIALELESYQKLGAQEGRQNRPPSNALAPDLAEEKLQAQTNQHRLKEQEKFHRKSNATRQSTAEISTKLVEVNANCEALTLPPSTTESAARHYLVTEKNRLSLLKQKELELRADLNGFKAENGITWLAHYPNDSLLHLSWIALCIAIEMVVNAFFFANEQGLLGGAVVALFLSITNIGLAGFFGGVSRYINHRSPLQKLLGWTSLGLSIITIIYINAVFSTFRSEYQQVTDPEDRGQLTVAFGKALEGASTIFGFHIPFTDILSFVLFFIGCLLGIYALYKGYTFDDPYPGHGARDRRYREAQSAYQAECDKVRKALYELCSQKQTALIRAKNDVFALGARLASLKGDINQSASEYSSTLQRIHNDYHLVLGTYRRSNTAVRATPAPNYFSGMPDTSIGPDGQTDDLQKQLADVNNNFQSLKSSYVDKLTSRLQEETDSATKIAGPSFNAYLDELLTLAEIAVAKQQQSIH